MLEPRNLASIRTVTIASILSLGLVASNGLSQDRPRLSPREIVERAGDAVVLIEVEKDGGVGQGSGFLVGPNGVLVTNLHVLDGATRVAVVFRDGTRQTEITVRAFDVERDLAAVDVDAAGRATLEIGDTSGLGPGSKILVIGNPLGLEQTVTEGIVSAWREPREEPNEAEAPGSFALALPPCRMIQISADIAAGSSGGPVLGENAEVIGVATSGVYGASGLNFAVPIDDVPELFVDDDAMDLETFGERVDEARLEKARPHFERARDAYERDESAAAQRFAGRALRLYPRYEDALLLSGRIAIESGQPDRAEQRLTEATRIDADHAEAWYLLGLLYHLQGVSTDDAGLVGRAEHNYRKALDVDSRHGEASFKLGVILAGRGGLDEAEELLQVAIASRTRFPDAHYTLGEIYLAGERIEDAKAEFEQALWEDEDHVLAHFGLAMVYTLKDQTAFGVLTTHGDAAHHWEIFLQRSEGVPSLASQRELAIRIVRQFLPHLMER